MISQFYWVSLATESLRESLNDEFMLESMLEFMLEAMLEFIDESLMNDSSWARMEASLARQSGHSGQPFSVQRRATCGITDWVMEPQTLHWNSAAASPFRAPSSPV